MGQLVDLCLWTSADGSVRLEASGGHPCSTEIQLLSSDEALRVGDQSLLSQLPSSCAPLPKVPCFLLSPLCLLLS